MKVISELTRSSDESISDDSMLTESVTSHAPVLAATSTVATDIEAMLAQRISRGVSAGVDVRGTGFVSTMAPPRTDGGIPVDRATGTAGPARTRSGEAAGGNPTSAGA